MEKDEEYHIIEDPSDKQNLTESQKIVIVIHTRKCPKLELVEQVNMTCHSVNGFECFVGTSGLGNEKQNFQVFGRNLDSNNKPVMAKTYQFGAFQEFLETMFKENHVSEYDTQNVVDLFVYLKTPLIQKNGQNIFPELELGFIAPKGLFAPKVFANVYELGTQRVKEVEFCHLNAVCKDINAKRSRKQESPKF